MSINGRIWVHVAPTHEIANFLAPYLKRNGWSTSPTIKPDWIEISPVNRFFGRFNWPWARFELGQVAALFPEYEIRYGNDLMDGPDDGVPISPYWLDKEVDEAQRIYWVLHAQQEGLKPTP